MSEDWLSGGVASRVGISGQGPHALWARSGCGSLGVQWVCAEDKEPRSPVLQVDSLPAESHKGSFS